MENGWCMRLKLSYSEGRWTCFDPAGYRLQATASYHEFRTGPAAGPYTEYSPVQTTVQRVNQPSRPLHPPTLQSVQ